MLKVHPTSPVPAETARIAHKIFPKGNRYLATLALSLKCFSEMT